MTDARSRVRSIVMAAGVVVTVGASIAGIACSSGGGKSKIDAAGDGISFDWRFGDLPPGCPPAAPNEKNIGKMCSRGGKECPGGLICACDSYGGVTPPEDTPCVCTIAVIGMTCASIPAGYCGTGASCCGYQNIGSLCVPDVCLPDGMCPMF